MFGQHLRKINACGVVERQQKSGIRSDRLKPVLRGILNGLNLIGSNSDCSQLRSNVNFRFESAAGVTFLNFQ